MDKPIKGTWELFFATGLPQAYMMAKGQDTGQSSSNTTDIGELSDAPYGESSGIAGCEL